MSRFFVCLFYHLHRRYNSGGTSPTTPPHPDSGPHFPRIECAKINNDRMRENLSSNRRRASPANWTMSECWLRAECQLRMMRLMGLHWLGLLGRRRLAIKICDNNWNDHHYRLIIIATGTLWCLVERQYIDEEAYIRSTCFSKWIIFCPLELSSASEWGRCFLALDYVVTIGDWLRATVENKRFCSSGNNLFSVQFWWVFWSQLDDNETRQSRYSLLVLCC